MRQAREQDLVTATRRLFDERGMQDAPIDEIARGRRDRARAHLPAVLLQGGALRPDVTDYLDELAGCRRRRPRGSRSGRARRRLLCAYADFCERYPAFLDCSLSLMHRPARELHAGVSESVWLRLGQSMAQCIDPVAVVLREGRDAGVFTVEDPDYMANVLWTQMLGTMHLARIRVGVRQLAPGIPALFAVKPDDVVRTCVDSALATVGARRPA
jgi:hypothetical protein